MVEDDDDNQDNVPKIVKKVRKKRHTNEILEEDPPANQGKMSAMEVETEIKTKSVKASTSL